MLPPNRSIYRTSARAESPIDDVLDDRRKRNIKITGCYFIRARNWATQSAKLFVAEDFINDVLQDGFWLSIIQCRRWELTPPRGLIASASKHQ